MRNVVLAVLAVAFVPDPVRSQSPAPAKAQVVTNPDWIVKPTGADIARYYPPLAAYIRLTGAAIMRCTVSAAGQPESCTVVREDHPGLGFGVAALGLSKLMKFRPKTVDGTPVGGAEVSIPVTFRMASPPPEDAAGSAPTELGLGAKALARIIKETAGYRRLIEQSTAKRLDGMIRSLPKANSYDETKRQSAAIEAVQGAMLKDADIALDQFADLHARKLSDTTVDQLVSFANSPAGQAWVAFQFELDQQIFTVGPSTNPKTGEDALRQFCRKETCS